MSYVHCGLLETLLPTDEKLKIFFTHSSCILLICPRVYTWDCGESPSDDYKPGYWHLTCLSLSARYIMSRSCQEDISLVRPQELGLSGAQMDHSESNRTTLYTRASHTTRRERASASFVVSTFICTPLIAFTFYLIVSKISYSCIILCHTSVKVECEVVGIYIC